MMADSEKQVPARRSRNRRSPARQAPPDDISRSLGRIEGSLQYLVDEMAEEKSTAAASRAAMHRRLDDQSDLIARLTGDVAIAVQVSAQAREEAKEVGKRIDDEVTPAVIEWRKILSMGKGMGLLLGIAGALAASTVWAAITFFGDAIAASIRSALRIP